MHPHMHAQYPYILYVSTSWISIRRLEFVAVLFRWTVSQRRSRASCCPITSNVVRIDDWI